MEPLATENGTDDRQAGSLGTDAHGDGRGRQKHQREGSAPTHHLEHRGDEQWARAGTGSTGAGATSSGGSGWLRLGRLTDRGSRPLSTWRRYWPVALLLFCIYGLSRCCWQPEDGAHGNAAHAGSESSCCCCSSCYGCCCFSGCCCCCCCSVGMDAHGTKADYPGTEVLRAGYPPDQRYPKRDPAGDHHSIGSICYRVQVAIIKRRSNRDRVVSALRGDR